MLKNYTAIIRQKDASLVILRKRKNVIVYKCVGASDGQHKKFISNSYNYEFNGVTVGWNLVKDSDSSKVSLNLNILLLVIFYLSFRTLFGFIMLIWSVVASNKFILCCQLLTLFDCCALIKLSESWHFVHCSGLVFLRFLSIS